MKPAATTELDALRFEQKRRKLAVFTLVLISPTLVFAGIDLLVLGRSDARFYWMLLIRGIAIAIAAFLISGAGLLFLVTRHVDLVLVERLSIATTLLIANGVGIAIVRNWQW